MNTLGYVYEQGHEIPVLKEAEVVVVGGGIAGIAAALAAARHGRRVLLMEREYALGGMATLGLVTIYLPLCDGLGNQLIFSIGEELLRRSVAIAPEQPVPAAWEAGGTKEARCKERYVARFNAQIYALAMEQLLAEEGVELLYGSAVCGAQVEDGRITSLIVENKSGRFAVACGSVIDCSGDADVCALAGAETALYGRGNALASWYYYYTGGKVQLKMFGLADVAQDNGDDDVGEGPYQAKKVAALDADFRFSGVDGMELSRAVQAAHGKMFADILKAREKAEDFVPVTMSTIPLVRMSRRLVGARTLDEAEDHVHQPDSIGMTGDWRKVGPAFEIPYGCLHNGKIKNLLAAGRDISVTDAMWDITRVIPPCAVTGQAAGTAAALTDDVTTLDVGLLQRTLAADGVRLHWAE